MRRLLQSVHSVFRAEGGQSTILLAVLMTVLLGMAGFSLDAGRVLYTYKQLQASTDAAALAGASAIAAGNGVSTANQYSSVSGSMNAKSNLPGVTMVSGYPKLLCLSTVTNLGEACVAPSNANAIQVRQQVTLNLLFMPLLGKQTLNINTVATASMKGSQRAPYNIAVIVDSTPSMDTQDTDPQCNNTRLTCALSAVQVLLQNLTPCPPNLTSCGSATNGNYQNPVDRVALYTFPSLYSAADVQHEYDCSGTAPQVNYYTDTTPGQTPTYTGPPSIYKVIDYSSDYKVSPNTTSLNGNSNLVKALSGCGMHTLQNFTYIAGAMYAAGTDLINLDSQDTSRQGVVVILTDGDMNVPYSYQYNGTTIYPIPNADQNSGTFVSTKNECAQAISLASYANYYNVRVYAVAYGAASSGCSTDTSGITPCQTVQQLASSPQYFYSDYTSSGGSSSCISAAHSTSNLNQIFQMIAADMSTSRLIPDNTT